MNEIKDPRFTSILDSAVNVFSMKNKTQVFTSLKVSTPMALGIFNPIILIPEQILNKWNNQQIHGILLHELSHIYHRDLFTGVLQRFITALNWWNPLAYTLSTFHSRAREEISDNYVLLQNDSKEYAECLITLAEKNYPVVVIIDSPAIASTQQILFDTLWRLL